jgi:hypothetical protein
MTTDNGDYCKLAKILGMLGSNQDGEVASAGRSANAFVKGLGKTWTEVLLDQDELTKVKRMLDAERAKKGAWADPARLVEAQRALHETQVALGAAQTELIELKRVLKRERENARLAVRFRAQWRNKSPLDIIVGGLAAIFLGISMLIACGYWPIR